MHRFTFLTLLLLTACGKDGDTSQTDAGSTSADPDTTATPTTGGTTGTADATTGSASEGDDTTGDTTANPTTGEATLTTTSASTSSTGDTTDTADTTTGAVSDFNRFLMNKAAGPCPPDADCDGFVELVAPDTLRVEKFGDVGDPVTEVQISADDFDAAAAVFADPALFALLAQNDIICDPPTDVFEDMLVDLGGNVATNSTTACDNPPVAAARAKADELAAKYVP